MRHPNVVKFARHVEYGDIFSFLFVSIIIRQYLWIVDKNIAWPLTLICAASLLVVHCKFKERALLNENSSKLFFVVLIILPLLLLYFLRASIPDTNFDVINYHITIAQRALNGFPYVKGDFFPTGMHTIPPTASMFLGVFRAVLGYRMGTLGNLLILIWTASISDRLLLEVIRTSWKRYVVVLLIISCEYILVEINSYMVDLLSLPLLLEAVALIISFERISNKKYYTIYMSLLLGLAVSLRLTNLAFVIPIIMVFAITYIKTAVKPTPQIILLSVAAFLFPLLPYSLYMYHLTSNPIFPYYNHIFKSPFWDLTNLGDLRWGPRTIVETIVWPVITPFVPSRFSELNRYSGRLAISFLAVLAYLLFQKRDKVLLYTWLASSLLWSMTTGYVRYAVFLEVMGGLVVMRSLFDPSSIRNKVFLKLQKPVFLGVIIFQAIFSYGMVYHMDWSWRSTILGDGEEHLSNLQYYFRDRSLPDYVEEGKRYLQEAGGWVICGKKTAGLATLLNPDIPLINVEEQTFFNNPRSFERYSQNLEDLGAKRLFAICPMDELDPCQETCRDNLRKRDFKIGKKVPVEFSYFGYGYYTVYLIELTT